jgi:hypothetical protein
MRPAMPEPQKNILGLPIAPCSRKPLTGFFRTGCCETGPEDRGAHVVCVVLTESFLAFSKERGNDLSTPRPEYGFPGLRPGDRWCLCASRWKEALDAGAAPRVVLASTHASALEYVSREDLLAHAVDSGSLN